MTEQKQHTFTEAPASWNIKYRVNGFEEQLTLRGESYAEIVEHVNAARSYVGNLIGSAPSNKAAFDAMNTEPPPVPPAPTTHAAAAPTVQTIRAVKLQVEPRADGKVNLNFFEAGHQYPDIKATKTPADAAILLQPLGGWTPQHFAAVAEYAISAVIDWKPSENLNKNGKPYKNIVTVSPA